MISLFGKTAPRLFFGPALFFSLALFFGPVPVSGLGMGVPQAAAATTLTVYTAVEPELLGRYAKDFEARNPGITIAWVRDSAGPIGARLLAEKNAPKADVVFGLALSSLLPLAEHGILEPYAPEGLENLLPGMYDTAEPPLWVGINCWGSAICVNTRELAKKGLPVPESWKDLADPKYKGLIATASPVSSSTMYMNVSAWLQSMGGEAAWRYMEDLHKNIKMYTHSGCKPAQMAAMGEVPIGMASAACAQPYIARKAPIKLVIPREGTGWDLEASALVKGGKNKEAAQKLLDFCTSGEVARVAVEKAYIPARADAMTEEAKEARDAFLPSEPLKAAASRRAVIDEWRSRFESR